MQRQPLRLLLLTRLQLGGDGSRQPSEIELGGARFQGKHIAELAKKLHG